MSMHNRFLRIAALAAVVFVLAGLSSGTGEAPIGYLDGLDGFGRPVTVESPKAQRHFDQGLTLYFGFHHDEAITSFQQAYAIEPAFAMAYWGEAMACGPNYNIPFMDEPTAKEAYDAAQKAASLATNVTPVERALIQAAAVRYAWPPPKDRASLDQAYADAMRKVWLQYPEDTDVGTLYAESMMDLRPWDLWTKDGKPQPGTTEIVQVLEGVLRVTPKHPGANHMLIHALENAPDISGAVTAADRLRTLVPGIGHLLHMASHVDIKQGLYKEAISANQRAVAADRQVTPERVPRHGYYTMYMAHDLHFIAYSAMFEGRRELATKAANDLVALLKPDMVRKLPDLLDGMRAIPIHVMVRFGEWDKLLAEPAPPDDLKASVAFWHYGRTVAYSALGKVDEARREFAALKQAAAEVPPTRRVHNNTVATLLDIALPMAEGELEYRQGNYDGAFELLREAVRRDDTLKYDEPWGWMQPVRHALGALLVEQNRIAEAKVVYEEDLKRHPGNGWALLGLFQAEKMAGETKAAELTEALYRTAFADSDIRTGASCYCAKRLAGST